MPLVKGSLSEQGTSKEHPVARAACDHIPGTVKDNVAPEEKANTRSTERDSHV